MATLNLLGLDTFCTSLAHLFLYQIFLSPVRSRSWSTVLNAVDKCNVLTAVIMSLHVPEYVIDQFQ